MRPSHGFWRTGEQGHIFQGNNGLKMSGTGERRQFWRTKNTQNRNKDYDLGNKAIYFRGTGIPPGRA